MTAPAPMHGRCAKYAPAGTPSAGGGELAHRSPGDTTAWDIMAWVIKARRWLFVDWPAPDLTAARGHGTHCRVRQLQRQRASDVAE